MSRPSVRGLLLPLLALLSVGGCGGGADLEATRRFEEANRRMLEAKQPDDALQAAALYEEVVARVGENGAALYDLGNAWLKAGKRGAAIAAYRRALRYRPGDPYLRANLALARGNAPEPPAALVEMLLFWQDDLSYPAKAWLFSGSVALASAAFLLVALVPRARPWARPLALLLAGVVLLAAASFALAVHDVEFTEHGVVAADVVARKGNAESFEPAFTEPLKEGAEFVLLERRGNWLRVRIGSGLEGWVPAERAITW